MGHIDSVPWLVSNIIDIAHSTAESITPTGERCILSFEILNVHFPQVWRPPWPSTSKLLTMVDEMTRVSSWHCNTMIDKMSRETPAAMPPPYYKAAYTIVLAPSGTSVLLFLSPKYSFSTRVARELCVVTPKLLNKTVFLPDFARHSAMYDLEPTELVMDLYGTLYTSETAANSVAESLLQSSLASTYCLGTFTIVLAPLGTMTQHSSWTPRLLSTTELLQFSSPTELCTRAASVFSRKLSTTELCEAIPGLLCRNPQCSSSAVVATWLFAKGPPATAETLPPKPRWALPSFRSCCLPVGPARGDGLLAC